LPDGGTLYASAIAKQTNHFVLSYSFFEQRLARNARWFFKYLSGFLFVCRFKRIAYSGFRTGSESDMSPGSGAAVPTTGASTACPGCRINPYPPLSLHLITRSFYVALV
jgi:hypothetical protein